MAHIRTKSLQIIERDNNTVDVFRGQGWNQHTVFERVDGYRLMLRQGEILTKDEYSELRAALKRK